MLPFLTDLLRGTAIAEALGATSARAIIAAIVAFAAVVLLMPRFCRALAKKSLDEQEGKTHSDKLNELHAKKRGTPAMGGLLVTAAVLAATLALARVDEPGVAVLVVATALLCALGCKDDLAKAAPRGSARGRGMSARTKLAAQVGVGLLAGGLMVLAAGHATLDDARADDGAPITAAPASAPASTTPHARPARVLGPDDRTSVFVPFASGLALPLGALFAFWVALVLVATSNAVNLTDGLDGLAAGTALPPIAAFGAIAYAASRPDWSAHLGVAHVPGAGELAVAASALAGGWLGFLWHNGHPADVFMGDSGSLPLGGAIALLACAVKHELLLPVIGAVFVAEALSVIVQVAWFKRTGRRVLLCAPLHHHFRFAGVAEPRVVLRFWIAGVVAALAGLLLLRIA